MLVLYNIRYALRTSVRSPGFAAVTAISLALGIGANTAIFSILDAVLFRELPVSQPRQLVELSGIYRNGGRVPFSFPMFQALDRWQRVFSGLYGWTGAAPSNVEAGSTLFLGGVRAVTGNYFSGLGAAPLLGSLIAPADFTGANAQVAVLGYECWENRFGRDPAVIGKTLRIEGKPFTIVGVTRQWFMGMTPGEPPDVTIPIVAAPFDRESRALLWIFATGRLRHGVSIVQARSQLASFWPELLLATVPTESRGPRRQSFLAMRLAVEPAAAGANTGLRDRVSRPLYLLMGVVVLILLIACVNLANLTLARAAARSHEMSTRAALGASRRQIVLQLLTESLLLSATGAALALAFAHWGSPLLLHLITRGTPYPIALDLRPDWRVFSFTAAVAVLTGAVIGLVPAWQMSRQEPALVLRQRGAGRGPGRSAKVLIVAQIALSLVLLFGAGLLLRTFENLRSSDPGFQRTGILEAGLHPRPDAGKGLDTNSYRQQLVERAAGLPGAISAAFSDLPVPAGDQGWRETVSPSGTDGNPELNVLATLAAVSPGFFNTLAIPVVSGRGFDWSDDQRHPPIAIVDSETARRLFPSGGAIGKRVRFGVQPEFQDLEIVGVVRAARLINLRDRDQRVIYVPCPQHPQYGEGGNLFVRANHAAALARALDHEVQSLGREYVTEAKTIEQMSDQALVAERATAVLSTAFAAAALLLAGIGLFGLMSYTVTRRTREIGIRMALGSQPRSILRMILRETLLLTLAGIALGAPCALAATRFIAHALFELSPVDPLTLAAASSALFAVVAIAGYLPARRALQADPMAALRCD
jgi:putative ABC transport system permease protein